MQWESELESLLQALACAVCLLTGGKCPGEVETRIGTGPPMTAEVRGPRYGSVALSSLRQENGLPELQFGASGHNRAVVLEEREGGPILSTSLLVVASSDEEIG